MLTISKRSRILAVSAVATAAIAVACADGDVSGPRKGRDENLSQAALSAYIVSSVMIPTADGMLVASDSTDGRLAPNGVRFDARLHPHVTRPSRNQPWKLQDRLRLPVGRTQTVSYKDSAGVRQTAALVYDETGRRPKFVLRFRNGKPLDAMELHYGKDHLQRAIFASFDTGAVNGRVAVQVDVLFGQDARAVATSERPGIRQLADLTSAVHRFFAPRLAYAEPVLATSDDDPCASCTPLFWTATGLSALAAAPAAAEAAAIASCVAGDVIICLELESFHAATVAAIAAAGAAWAEYAACKARGGGDVTDLRPGDGKGEIHPISFATPQRHANTWRLASAAYAPRVAAECEDPAPGGGGGGGGGGGSNCWTEHWIVQISYDGGSTWDDLWEGDVTVCDYII